MHKWFLLTLLLVAACSVTNDPVALPTSQPAAPPTEAKTTVVTAPDAQINRRVETNERITFGLTLPRDAIRPIYEPKFVQAKDAPYQDAELVMGVAFGDEARAYPISVLRFREMVNDELDGIPILVSW